MHFVAPVTQLAGQGYDLAYYELGDRPGVRERGVENADAMSGRVFEVDLVCTNTEAAHDDEVLRCREDSGGQLSLASYTQDVDVFDLLDELIFWQTTLHCFHLVALAFQHVYTCRVHVF